MRDNGEGRVEEIAMPNLGANHMGTYVPISMGPPDPCPICALFQSAFETSEAL